MSNISFLDSETDQSISECKLTRKKEEMKEKKTEGGK